MPIKVFYSYHHKLHQWRAAQIREIAPVEGNLPASDLEWERVTEEGEFATERWINAQLFGRTCLIVLVGPATAGRKWINYEINKAWTDNKGVVGIHVHNLKDRFGNQSADRLTRLTKETIAYRQALKQGRRTEIAFEAMRQSFARGMEAPALDQVVKPKVMRTQSGRQVAVKAWNPLAMSAAKPPGRGGG